MPRTAIDGTYEHPGIPGATVTAGPGHVQPWLVQRWDRLTWLACDIETYGLGTDALRLKCVTFATEDAALILDPRDPHQARLIQLVFQHVPMFVFHNAPFDVIGLTANHLMQPEHVLKVVDTVVYARLAQPGELIPKSLEACTTRELGITSGKMLDTFKVLGLSKSDGYRVMDVDSPAYLYGAAADGIVTARLLKPLMAAAYARLTQGHPYADQQPQAPGWAWEEIEKRQRYNRIQLRRSVQGLRVDLEYLEQFRRESGPARAAGEQQLQSLGIDPGNGNHLAKFLLDQGMLPSDHPRTKTGKPSTQAAHLEELHHPVAQLFVRVKQMSKIQDDYLQKMVDLSRPDAHGDLRIHPVTNVLAAAHGRDSMGDPPIHQLPGGARGIVLPERGDEFASVDWSQQEPVMGFNLAGDLDPLFDYENSGKKIYEFVSNVSGVAYKPSKIVLLAGMYGQGLASLSRALKLDPGPWVLDQKSGDYVPTYRAARDIRNQIFGSVDRNGRTEVHGAVHRTGRYLEHLRRLSKQYGSVVTINGRILPIPMGFRDGRKSIQSHKAGNYQISGSANDQLVDVVLELDRQGLITGYYHSMHDENVVSKEIMRETQRIMEIPPEGLVRMAKREPKIRTDVAVLGERWSADA